MNDLKNCPFCDGKPRVIEYSSYGSPSYLIACCYCHSGTSTVKSLSKAMASWNKRFEGDLDVSKTE